MNYRFIICSSLLFLCSLNQNLSLIASANAQNLKASRKKVFNQFVVPANKAYAEPLAENPRNRVSIPVGYPEDKGVVSRWRDKGTSVVWYLYQKAGSYDLSFANTVLPGTDLTFNLSISSSNDDPTFKTTNHSLRFKASGKADTLLAAKVLVPKAGYFKYTLTPVSEPASRITINSLLFNSFKEGGQVNQTDYQSSPSVHLSFSATSPTTKSYDWIYQEVEVPQGGDALATYYMSLGFYRGYMGIQTNSPTERRVLFSVWDSKDAENDASITKHDYVSLVDKGAETTVNSFGGEGTGGQSYVKGANWKTAKPVKFLMNVRPESNNSVVLSAWYKVDQEEWKYVASWRAPKEQRYFDGFYSFLENFGYSNGQLRRQADYYNAWGRENGSGKWVNLNKVRFSNTDGKEGQRVDYEQGVSKNDPNRFYMSSGGYTPTVKTANEVAVATDAPFSNLSEFESRVNQALKAEVLKK